MTFKISDIFKIKNENEFNNSALNIFKSQSENNPVYKEYIRNLNINLKSIKHYTEIPFLPIDFFKTHKVISSDKKTKTTFQSSGTSRIKRSNHHIIDLSVYEKSFTKAFKLLYGKPENYTILALLPSYSEQGNSSLIYMLEKLMQLSNNPDNGFYLYNHSQLVDKLSELEKRNKKTILFGVSFALIDFFENYHINLKNTAIIETGGMKGRKKEIVREELHKIIKTATGLKHIHSEYGMTELLSQAYAKTENKYANPTWMKILIRDANDPFSYLPKGQSGGINIIDSANIYSCSFIETKDLGKLHPDNTFEVLGRFDNSDIRGCNLMVV